MQKQQNKYHIEVVIAREGKFYLVTIGTRASPWRTALNYNISAELLD